MKVKLTSHVTRERGVTNIAIEAFSPAGKPVGYAHVAVGPGRIMGEICCQGGKGARRLARTAIGPVGYFGSIGSYPEARGQGVGQALQQQVLKELRERDVEFVMLHAVADDEGARSPREVKTRQARLEKWYGAQGFRKILKHDRDSDDSTTDWGPLMVARLKGQR